jgi:hypothetical protein
MRWQLVNVTRTASSSTVIVITRGLPLSVERRPLGVKRSMQPLAVGRLASE